MGAAASALVLAAVFGVPAETFDSFSKVDNATSSCDGPEWICTTVRLSVSPAKAENPLATLTVKSPNQHFTAAEVRHGKAEPTARRVAAAAAAAVDVTRELLSVLISRVEFSNGMSHDVEIDISFETNVRGGVFLAC